MARKLDLTNQRFGHLLAIEDAGREHGKTVLWKCECDCGNVCIVRSRHLVQGRKISCGYCLKDRHGMSNTVEYRAYGLARNRCTNLKYEHYADYGGRGIEFRFKNFTEFYRAVGSRPSNHHSIDRIDPDGHYEPGNVRWATKSQQARNRHRKNWRRTIATV